ncbi:MAG TPA: GAF domain-containing sensor histidine kinase [Gemmatirosa sp.]
MAGAVEQPTSAAPSRADALLAITGALVRAATPEAVAAVVVEHAARALAARRGAFAFLASGAEGTEPALEIVAAWGYSDTTVAGYRRVPLAAAFPLCDVVRTGEPVLLSTAQARRAMYPNLARLADENGAGAMAAVPLLVPELDGAAPRAVGALGFNFDDEREFEEADRAFLIAVAQQCAHAVERAQLYAAERAARAEAEVARLRAEEANRSKSQFLANMSHELRTPLNAIAGYVQLLDMGLHGPVTDAQRDALGRVDRAQRRLLGLVTDVLSYAKLENGRMEYDVRPVAIAEVLDEIAPLVEPQLAAKGLTFDRGPLDARTAVVWADREKLGQVLMNLLSNAVKFTPKGGRVSVAVLTRTATRETGRGGVAFLRVTDSGIGIPRDQQEAVFEPFVQVKGGYTRTHDGTGLGLAIARELARGMGGDLRLRSREGGGATFTVTLRLT